MLKSLLLFFFIFSFSVARTQTFTATGGTIPDNGAFQSCFPLQVTGIGNISSSLGVSSVCINIDHPWLSDLEIYLTAPDGTEIPLSIQNGGSGSDYSGTCFSGTATIALENGLAPFNGSYLPDGYLGAVNNGQDADRTWNLCIKDIAAGQTGSLTSWSISFSTGLPPGPPSCNINLTPGTTCATATPVCSFFGFCSATSSSYTADSWPELDTAFCGTVQNNAFVKFVATGYEMNFNVWVTSSTNHDGIQLLFFDGGCGSGPVTNYGCYSPVRPGASPSVISATGLTAGNTYYLMIDGFAGDECNYVIEPIPATGGLALFADTTAVCPGKSVQLTATGGNGTYSWTGQGLSSSTGNVVTASPTVLATYTVSSIDPGGICPITKEINLSIRSLPAAPIVTDTTYYCQHASAGSLTAPGSNLLWYQTASGGTGSQAIIPPTTDTGIFTFHVTHTSGCESLRSPVYVKIKATPDLGPDKQVTLCAGKTANLTSEFNTNGLFTSWMFNNAVIAPPVAAAQSGIYWQVANNNNNCADTGVIRLIIQPPVHVFIGNDTIAVKGTPHQLHSSPAASYSWSPAYLLNDPFIQYPVATLTQDQQFILNVTDVAGCPGSDTIVVKIINGITYYIPNAFTPNNDGLNDIFRALPVGIKSTEYFRIINRYGKLIFETSDPFNKGWDGSCMGYRQSPGTYVWFIKGVDINGKKVEMKGTVLLIQ